MYPGVPGMAQHGAAIPQGTATPDPGLSTGVIYADHLRPGGSGMVTTSSAAIGGLRGGYFSKHGNAARFHRRVDQRGVEAQRTRRPGGDRGRWTQRP